MSFRKSVLGALVLLVANVALAQKPAKLHKKELNPYGADFMTTCRLEHDSARTWLLVQSKVTRYNVSCRGYTSYKGKEKLFDLYFPIYNIPGDTVRQVELPVYTNFFVLEVIITDADQRPIFTDVLQADRSVRDHAWYTAMNAKGMPLARPFVPQGSRVWVQYLAEKQKPLYVFYYKAPMSAAPPPFAIRSDEWELGWAADSAWLIDNGAPFPIKNEGMYFFSVDSMGRSGYPISCFGGDFPDLTKSADLALSIRYITRNEEYDELTGGENIKLELDKFWLKTASGDKERARNLIKTYYNRIRRANLFFSDCKEGWKTDRGIIYTIFGPPTRVFKSMSREEWIYPATILRESVKFIFEASKARQWIMRRDYYMRQPWSAQVYEWREGIPFDEM